MTSLVGSSSASGGLAREGDFILTGLRHVRQLLSDEAAERVVWLIREYAVAGGNIADLHCCMAEELLQNCGRAQRTGASQN